MFANRTQRAMGSVINLEPDETRFSVYLRLSDGFWKMKKIRNGCRVAGDHCRAVSAFEAERDCVLDKQFNDSFDVHRSYRQVVLLFVPTTNSVLNHSSVIIMS